MRNEVTTDYLPINTNIKLPTDQCDLSNILKEKNSNETNEPSTCISRSPLKNPSIKVNNFIQIKEKQFQKIDIKKFEERDNTTDYTEITMTKKRKRVKFKLKLVETVEIESYKYYNSLMCFVDVHRIEGGCFRKYFCRENCFIF